MNESEPRQWIDDMSLYKDDEFYMVKMEDDELSLLREKDYSEILQPKDVTYFKKRTNNMGKNFLLLFQPLYSTIC